MNNLSGHDTQGLSWRSCPGVIQARGMVGQHELTDATWARIEPLLPPAGRRGGRWRDHRQVINAILWQANNGAP